MPNKMRVRVRFRGRFLAVEERVLRDGHRREIVQNTDSVGFLIDIPAWKAIVMVSQFRPAMLRPDNPEGMILEVPAGRFDRRIDVKALIAAEASEEVGAKIAPNQVRLLNGSQALAMSPGILTERMHLAFVRVRPGQLDASKQVFGLKEEGERTKRVLVPYAKLRRMRFDDLKTFALVQWFLRTERKEAAHVR